MTDPIGLYSKTTACHELSNFASLGFEVDGAYWPTVEHYFQGQKFPGAADAVYREKIRARGPRPSARRQRPPPGRGLTVRCPLKLRPGKGKNRLGRPLAQVRAAIGARGE